MSSIPSSSRDSSPQSGKEEEIPAWAKTLLAENRQVRQAQEAMEARFEALARSLKSADEKEEAATAKEEKALVGTDPPAPDNEEPKPPVDSTPPEISRTYGKLDSATLCLFQRYGSDDLSCAEVWIADAERHAKDHNLTHHQLCRAFYQGTVGEVRAYLDTFGDDTRNNWPELRRSLLDEFSKELQKPKHVVELALMNGIAGLSLQAAIDRVKRLIAATDHPDTDLGPVWAMTEEFPAILDFTANTKEWESCQEAFDDLRKMGRKFKRTRPGTQMIARSKPKVPLRTPTVGPVATVESATTEEATEPVAMVTRRPPKKPTTWRCHRCGGRGHSLWQCPTKETLNDKQSKN